jgi:putative transposase
VLIKDVFSIIPMKVTRAWKFRLYPTKAQAKEMQMHLWLSKNLWNDLLELTKQIYANYGKFSTAGALNELAKTSGLYSQVAQDVFRRLNKSIYGMIERRKKGTTAGFPRFKNMGKMKSLTYPQFGFSLNGKRLDVSPFGEINIKKHREVKGTIKTLTLKREGDRWFAILTAETEAKTVPKNNGSQVGIDLGLMTFATLSNGEKIKKPKHFKIYEDKLAKGQRNLSRKLLRSKNRRKVKIRVARIHSRIANVRKDWLHKTANDLLSRYSLIAFEHLDVQGISEEHGRGTGDAGWSIFTNIISYKAESAGCEVVFVNPNNTTKDCSGCGTNVPKELRERWHDCPSCGLSLDRDFNAAINILNRATAGIAGSNAFGDVSKETSLKKEAHAFKCG